MSRLGLLRTLAASILAGAFACSGPSGRTIEPVVTSAAAAPTPPSLSPSSSDPALVIRIGAAPYRLDAPVQREITVLDGGTVYLAGGLAASGASVSGVFALNPTTGTLTALGSMPGAFHDAAGAMIGGRLFAFGGGEVVGTDIVQAFDPATRTSAIVGHLPVALSDLSAATIGNTVYLVGGYDGHAPRREIYATTDGTSFRIVGRLPSGLRYPAVTAVGPLIVIAGGQGANGPIDSVTTFDTNTGKIASLGTLPVPVAHAAAITLSNLAYIIGGRDASDRSVATVDSIDPTSGAITHLPPLRHPVADAGAVSGPGGALLLGGWRGIAVPQVLSASLVAPTEPARASPTPSSVDPARIRPFAGSFLIADRGNNRLLVMNARKHIVWRYPAPDLPAPATPLYFPDDAFWVHRGHAILVNEEENNSLIEIAYPSGRVLWTYGHPRVSGSSSGYLHQPDDLYPYPGGGVVVSDAKNCRIQFFDAAGHPTRQIGTTGICVHGLPGTVGYPNGDTPLPNGHLLLSETYGGWVDEVTADGHVVWSRQIPGVSLPSDPQRLADGSYLVASYVSPGAVVRFNRSGKVLWTYRPISGPGVLDHPSLAAPLPNGLIAINDDYNHRVVLVDPKTDRIVWQYGTGTAGAGVGQLSYPDGLDLLLPGGVDPPARRLRCADRADG